MVSGPHVCPICAGRQFQDFNGRVGAKCTSCHSVERERLLGLLILDRAIPASAPFFVVEAAESLFNGTLLQAAKCVKLPEIFETPSRIPDDAYLYLGHNAHRALRGSWSHFFDRISNRLMAGGTLLMTLLVGAKASYWKGPSDEPDVARDEIWPSVGVDFLEGLNARDGIVAEMYRGPASLSHEEMRSFSIDTKCLGALNSDSLIVVTGPGSSHSPMLKR